MKIIDLLAILIPSSVTILGFFITYFININNMKNQFKIIELNFKNELIKKKSDLSIEKMSDAIVDILNLATLSIIKLPNCKNQNEKKNILNEIENKKIVYNVIYAYGSADAIKILSYFSKLEKTNTNDNYKVISLYQLLVIQIKYDIMNVVVSPTSWIEMILNSKEFEANKEKIIKVNNDLVDELKLNNEFKIYY